MNRKLIFQILPFASLVFLISSCLTLGTVEIEVLKPAKISLPSNVNSILVLNNSLLYHEDSFKHEVQRGLFQLDTAATQVLVSQVNQILNESPRFDTSILIKDIYFRSADNLLQPISKSAIKRLCNEHNTDAVVSLDAFGLIDSVIRFSYFDGYGYTNYKSLVLVANSMWRIYLADNNEILDKRIRRDTIFIDDLTSIKEYHSAILYKQNIDYLADKIANAISIQIADIVAPYWQPIQRDFYIFSNEQMQLAAKYAYNDQWLDAALIWKTFTDDDNLRLAAAACYNMALVCEVEGKLEIAVEWLEESLNKSNTYISNNYLIEINRRIKESTRLDKQFGVE